MLREVELDSIGLDSFAITMGPVSWTYPAELVKKFLGHFLVHNLTFYHT